VVARRKTPREMIIERRIKNCLTLRRGPCHKLKITEGRKRNWKMSALLRTKKREGSLALVSLHKRRGMGEERDLEKKDPGCAPIKRRHIKVFGGKNRMRAGLH